MMDFLQFVFKVFIAAQRVDYGLRGKSLGMRAGNWMNFIEGFVFFRAETCFLTFGQSQYHLLSEIALESVFASGALCGVSANFYTN